MGFLNGEISFVALTSGLRFSIELKMCRENAAGLSTCAEGFTINLNDVGAKLSRSGFRGSTIFKKTFIGTCFLLPFFVSRGCIQKEFG